MSRQYCNKTFTFHKPKILKETDEVLMEYCENCKEEMIFTKSKRGEIDTEKYRVFHAKDLLQPGDREFATEYGKA